MTKVLEGTWNELAAHAAELEGCHLRLTVLDEAPSPTNGVNDGETKAAKPQTLAEALAGRTGTFDFGPTNVARDGKRLWQEYAEEKHRRIKERKR